MIFSATFACARCRLRFARRARCPSCGGTEIHALSTRDGRARYRAAARTKAGGGQGILLRLAPWAPQRIYVPIGVALLLIAPAVAGLAMGLRSFQNLWLMDDGTTRYEGLSSAGFTMIALAVAGASVLLFTIAAKLGSAMAERARPAAPTRMRVFSPAASSRGETVLAGIARRASVEIESVASGEPCLIFGIRGEIGDADVADADGGDFDLELPSGERVMISLEHAILVPSAPVNAAEIAVGDALAELLENRAIQDAGRAAALEEHLVRDGDRVTVVGTLLGGKVTSLGGGGGVRVLAGDEDRPLVVEK